MSQMGMPMAFALLEGPTKALVKSAFTAAGLGSTTLLTFSPNTALCITYRQAYDDDVFKSTIGSEDGTPDFSTPYDIIKDSSSPYSKKLRPIGYDALEKLASTRNITLTLGRNVALSSLMTLNRYIGDLLEAEEHAAATGQDPIYPPNPLKDFRHSAKVGCLNACLDWTTQMLRSILDWMAATHVPLPLSRRIRKDLRASAMRKDHYTFYYRTPRVARTSLFSESTLYLADWLITCCLETYNALVRKPTISEIIATHGVIYPRSKKLKLLGIRCGLQAGRCTAVWLATSSGNGIGSTAPMKYRGIAMFICANLAGMGTNLFANAFIARFTADEAALGGPPPIIGPPIPPPAPLTPPPSAAAASVANGDEVARGQEVPAAAMQALRDLMGNNQPQVPFGGGGGDGGEVAPRQQQQQQEPAAAAELLPDAPQNQEARPRVGPRLPERRPRRNNINNNNLGAAGNNVQGDNAAAPGPDTPQSARDPPLVVVAEEDRAEVEPVLEEEEEEEEEQAVAVAIEVEEAMPPATPPTADDTGARDE